MIARVFNKPTLEASSFYVDSDPQNVPTYGGGKYGVVAFNLGATTNELDSTDHDSDGLSRSWEKSYGTDPNNPDTDNDGMSDGHEVRAGTNPTDDSSTLLMVQLAPDVGNNLRVYWDSVPGKRYQLQYVEALTNNAQFININGVIKATSEITSDIVTNGLLNPQAMYRVQLVERNEDTPPPLTPP
ncbi:MAG: thrombospondin type 3 repeat-containing protein [Kiritimatiellae bacterium]|nr:thrombospondin type 3 repeat-containing protein [Kiritimatiellia bacterium]